MLTLRDMNNRLQRLEKQLIGNPVYVLVRDPTGQEEEMTVSEFDRRRKAEGLVFQRIVRGYDPTGRDIDIILSSWDSLACMDREI